MFQSDPITRSYRAYTGDLRHVSEDHPMDHMVNLEITSQGNVAQHRRCECEKLGCEVVARSGSEMVNRSGKGDYRNHSLFEVFVAGKFSN